MRRLYAGLTAKFEPVLRADKLRLFRVKSSRCLDRRRPTPRGGQADRQGARRAGAARCVLGLGNTALPSIAIVVEGRADPLTDEDTVRRIDGR
jgi:hypothetical protein